MKTLIASTVTLLLLAGSAYAQDAASANSDCAARASDKKLHGAALNSFMKKCERDTAKTTCDTSAAEKKLRGAAKNSFVTKCVKDATAH